VDPSPPRHAPPYHPFATPFFRRIFKTEVRQGKSKKAIVPFLALAATLSACAVPPQVNSGLAQSCDYGVPSACIEYQSQLQAQSAYWQQREADQRA
jgi:hypothetical protein